MNRKVGRPKGSKNKNDVGIKREVKKHTEEYIHISKKWLWVLAIIYVPVWIVLQWIMLLGISIFNIVILFMVQIFGLVTEDAFGFTYKPSIKDFSEMLPHYMENKKW